MVVPIYRAAYVFEGTEDARMFFSEWVQADGRDEIVAKLAAVNPSVNGSEAGVSPTIVGWEKKNLEDPELD